MRVSIRVADLARRVFGVAAWLGIVVYTWVAPGLFRRALEKELVSVKLDRQF